MKKSINISVRSLVEYALRSGDLSLEFRGAARALEGLRAHQRIQKKRPDHYVPEVTVSYQVEVNEFILSVNGRIDGVFECSEAENDGFPVIEEIKTTNRNPEWFEKNENPVHWGQLKCYALFYAVQYDLEKIDTRLTYFQIETSETREFNKRFDTDDLRIFFEKLANQYIGWVRGITKWEEQRDQSINRLGFPFAEYRDGQRDMAVSVYRTIRDQGQLIAQAATGIGKTMAVLFPAVKAMAEAHHSKIFYLTARTTGKNVCEKALDELRANGLRLKSITLTAKDRVCFSSGSACTGEDCTYAKGYYDRVTEAIQSIFKTDAFDRETVEECARENHVCPFEFSLELSLWSDCVICDYNYAFDPRVYLRRFFSDEDGKYTFLIDEAHNLVDRSREMFSAAIRKQPFLDLRRTVRDDLPQIYKSMGKINSWLIKARKKCEEAGNVLVETNGPDSLYQLLWFFLKTTERWLSKGIKTEFRDVLLDLYFSVAWFMKVGEGYDQSYATCYETVKKDLGIKLFCIDPSSQLKEALKRSVSAIFFSATMTPADYFKNVLGCDEQAKNLILPSPFPVENLSVFIADRISTYYKQRNRTAPDVVKAIISLVGKKKGNYLIFFPSYQYLLIILELFQDGILDMETICQTPGMSEHERDAFLKRFDEDNSGTLVGFVVMGGVFGEGIDLTGERLSGAVIVGVGLPGICLERELIRKFFAEVYHAGFEYAYLYPGINRVLQAAGRVIRSENDRGVVLLIDQRFATRNYRGLLPSEWQLSWLRQENQLSLDLKKFWNTKTVPLVF